MSWISLLKYKEIPPKNHHFITRKWPSFHYKEIPSKNLKKLFLKLRFLSLELKKKKLFLLLTVSWFKKYWEILVNGTNLSKPWWGYMEGKIFLKATLFRQLIFPNRHSLKKHDWVSFQIIYPVTRYMSINIFDVTDAKIKINKYCTTISVQ